MSQLEVYSITGKKFTPIKRTGAFYKLVTTQFGFHHGMGCNVGIYVIRKMHYTPIENCIPSMSTSQQHVTTSIEVSSSYPLETVIQGLTSLNSSIH